MRWATAAVLGLWAAHAALGQEKERKYPAVSLADTFAVEATWPQRPADVHWAAVTGIAVDAQNRIHILSRTRKPVQVYDASGKFLNSWGLEHLPMPHQLRIDKAGHVWVTDIEDHVVQKFSADGKLLATLGVKGKLGRDDKHLNMPTDVAFGPNGDVYVSDGYGNARIVQFDAAGKFVRAWGELGHRPGQFSIPHSIVCDAKGRVYVADRNNARIQVFEADGTFVDEWRNLLVPWGLAIDPSGDVWACGSSPMQWRPTDMALGCPPNDQLVMRFRNDGRLVRLVHFPKGADGFERPGELNWVHCLAFDPSGNLYMGDVIGRRAQKFVPRPGQPTAK